MFLAKNIENGDLCTVLIRYDKSLQNMQSYNDLSKWSIQKFVMSPFENLKEKLHELKQAFLLQTDSLEFGLGQKLVKPTILFATLESIYLAEEY